jgi:D-3-phosphoglycerate dehydrogenase
MEFRFVMAEGAAPNLDVEHEFLKDQDVEVRITPLDTAEKVSRETAGADGVIVALEPLPREFIESFQPEVKIIGRAGIGLDAIDLDAARDRGVAVFHTPDYATEEVATHALALMLALNRRIVEGNELARTDWEAYEKLGVVTPLSEQVIGIVGLGRIGLAVVERLRPFRPRIVAFDPFVESAPDGVALLPRLDDFLTQVDVLTLHLPLTPETTKIIGPREIGLLRAGATLINVSRGGLVDESALTDALAKGVIRAGLDVLAMEPPPLGAAILASPNVILTPHFAWYSASSERRVRTEVLAGMLDYLRDEPPRTGRLVIDPGEFSGGR